MVNMDWEQSKNYWDKKLKQVDFIKTFTKATEESEEARWSDVQ